MKKFLIFISFLLVLVVSEYYFLNELFSHQRLPILSISLLVVVFCIVAFLRFFKKNILQIK
jgi:hypothetical protein